MESFPSGNWFFSKFQMHYKWFVCLICKTWWCTTLLWDCYNLHKIIVLSRLLWYLMFTCSF
jgi:hypothetical protein